MGVGIDGCMSSTGHGAAEHLLRLVQFVSKRITCSAAESTLQPETARVFPVLALSFVM